MTLPATTPYPWPYDGALVPPRSALVVCGSGPEWSARTPFDPEAEAAIAGLRWAAARAVVVTVLIRHLRPSARPVDAAVTTPSPELEAAGDEITVEAAGIDGFYGSGLDPLLRRHRRSHLLLVGRGLETAVSSTLRRANDRGYECLTVADACAALDPGCRAPALSSIEMSGGIFGAVGTAAAVLDALTSSPLSSRTEQESP